MSGLRILVGCKRVIDYAVKVGVDFVWLLLASNGFCLTNKLAFDQSNGQ